METKLNQNELSDILSALNKEEYPECLDRLTEAIAAPPMETTALYTLATDLLSSDKPKNLPPCLVDFITRLLLLCIEQGDENAMNDLGAQYYDGYRGFEQNFDKAISFYDMAAEHGSRQAQENLGYCYYYGRSGTVDYEKAFHYFALGAFDGHLISLYKIGDMYLNGYYVRKNETEAFHIYMRCLETMTDTAAPEVAGQVYLRLGKMFLKGLGTEKNVNSALICYQKAENYLYDMVKGGDVMYKKSLLAAIEGQNRAREILMSELSDGQWLDGQRD